MPAEAEQYFTIDDPGFVWKVRVKMAPFLYLVKRGLSLWMLQAVVDCTPNIPTLKASLKEAENFSVEYCIMLLRKNPDLFPVGSVVP